MVPETDEREYNKHLFTLSFMFNGQNGHQNVCFNVFFMQNHNNNLPDLTLACKAAVMGRPNSKV